MALEDRIRSSLDPALGELTARLDADVRALIQQLTSTALEERDEAVTAARRDAGDEATAYQQREVEEAEARGRTAMNEAVQKARAQEREAEMVALARLLDGVCGLDGASSLREVLDVLGQSADREASRTAVLVVKRDRLLGWKLLGFGPHDTQPKAIDLSLEEGGIVGLAVAAARPITTRGGDTGPPDQALQAYLRTARACRAGHGRRPGSGARLRGQRSCGGPRPRGTERPSPATGGSVAQTLNKTSSPTGAGSRA